MFNNQHLFQHIERQPNVILVIIGADGQKTQIFNRLCTADVYVVDRTLLLEVKMYANGASTEPQQVSTYVNPIKWDLVGQPDPEGLQ